MASFTETISDIKKGKVANVYLFYGTEAYFMQRLKNQLIKKVIQPGEEENMAAYNLEETPVQEMIADAETYPFFGEKKLIIANQPSFLQAKPKQLSFQHDVDLLDQYVKNPAPYTVVVLLADYEKIDKRKKINKALQKHGVTVSCEPIKPYEAKKWLQHMAGRVNVSIDQDAAELLEAELSTNLFMMQNEIEKLAFYAGDSGTITKEMAETLLAQSMEQTSLQLVEAVINGDLEQAISIHNHLLDMKEEPIAMVALLGYQFRTILQIKRLKEKGYSQGHMQKQLGVHPYVIKINAQREGRFTDDQLRNILIQLTQTDAVLKQGKMDKRLAFELLLYALVQARLQPN
ncbi:DNA-directed DNA polymerase [Lentibacillus sp. JNUCC-1]|uniref:DNA polymerase III subunit delta n=1 Tax=Lentibacillus sp. JNUCC-1 TaxID=2654513 RepID=UPI0012E744E3|nr:DNA polymerase III subunit delta [Lentibacillus sp. JNUCC-1]MUV39576.1 DNA-directed DNA polymerase [Lentibacillus sp. JNUCC-1]